MPEVDSEVLFQPGDDKRKASFSAAAPAAVPWRVTAAGFVGTTLEFYDFFIYGTMAALVFQHLFFPGYSAFAGTLASFGTFAVGFVARPLGSAFFGVMGDKFGRRFTLVLSLSMMGGATVLIGMLPTYASVGVLAPVLLIAIRLAQGLALGGEWGGAALLLVENAPDGKKSLMGSVVQMGAPAGLLLATGITSCSNLIAGERFLDWGWRLPFLFSAVLLAVAAWIRHGVSETPEYLALRERSNALPRLPIRNIFRSRWRALLIAFGLASPGNAVFFLISTYSLSYATGRLGLPRTPVLIALMAASLIYLFAIPYFGNLADRIGGRKVIGIGCVAALAFAAGYFALLDTRSPFMIGIAMACGLAIVHAALQAPQAALFSSWFAVGERYTGIALAQALPTTIVGGTVPLIATLSMASKAGTTAIEIYLMGLALLGLLCVVCARYALPRVDKRPDSIRASTARQ